MVRQRSAKPLRPGSNPGGASKTKRVERLAFFVLGYHLILCTDRNAGGSSRVSAAYRRFYRGRVAIPFLKKEWRLRSAFFFGKPYKIVCAYVVELA